MPSYDTVLFHGSALAIDGDGYLFTAKSGTGKSTHTRLWRERFGDRVVMINDDKPLLHIDAGSVIAYGTPWNGKHRLGTNASVPLRADCVFSDARSRTAFFLPSADRYILHCSDRPTVRMIRLRLYVHLSLLTALRRSFRFGRCNATWNHVPQAVHISECRAHHSRKETEMKLKDTYISHESDGEQVLVDASCEFSGVIRNNSTSAFIVELLRHDTTLDEIADAMFEKYDAPRDRLRADAEAVIEKLRSVGAIEE